MLIFKAVNALYKIFTIKPNPNIVLNMPGELVGQTGNAKITLDSKEHFIDNYKSALKNDPQGMYNVACCYRGGIGTEINIPNAIKWAKKLANDPDSFWRKERKKLLKGMKKDIKTTCVDGKDELLTLVEEALKLFVKK